MSQFAGRWITMFGPMELTQEGDQVHGTYRWNNQEGTINGQVEGTRLHFEYREPAVHGEGWFELIRPSRFEGQWRQDGSDQWGVWLGERGFEGIWETSFGLVRLLQERDRVFGFYEGIGQSRIDGQVHGDDRLEFRYQEPRAGGSGYFTLSKDGLFFQGEWLPDGGMMHQPWSGRRLWPMPGRTWLVVIEAHWQRHLLDKEYSFGNMLKEFFARLPHVHFAHRFFNNEAGLRQWCRDLMYIPEPTIVMIATHGTAEGLSVHGQTVTPTALSETLRYADNIKLLHFSACLMMKDGPGMDMVRELRKHARYPISGYTTSVDWAASAIAEFTYLDLMLGKGLTPTEAAEQLPQLLSFGGPEGTPSGPYPATGFRMLAPVSPIV